MAWAKATVILSRSTLHRLFREHMRYPVGRVRHQVLGPFSFSEFLWALDKAHLAAEVLSANTEISGQRHELRLSLLDRFLAVGGLPAVVQTSASGDDHRAVRRQITADYEQDFIRFVGEELIDIVKACFPERCELRRRRVQEHVEVPSPSSRMNERINHVFARLESWHLMLRSEQRGSSAALPCRSNARRRSA